MNPCFTHEKKYITAFVHGSDWKTGTQAAARQRVIDCLKQWDGELVEPEYSAGVSTTQIIASCKEADK